MPDVTYLPEHAWVGATNVPLDTKTARIALRRRAMRLGLETEVSVLEVYCRACRRPFDDVADEPCAVGQHLIGGPIGTRKKRKRAQGDDSADEAASGG